MKHRDFKLKIAIRRNGGAVNAKCYAFPNGTENENNIRRNSP